MGYTNIAKLLDYLAIALIFVLLGISSIKGLAVKAECSENYSPCTCSETSGVICSGVQPTQIKEVFSRTSHPILSSLEIILPPDAGTLPSDILSGKAAVNIIIRGSGRDLFQLTIDMSAFRPSRNVTTNFEISDADLNQLDFDFLDGFVNLNELHLRRISGIRMIKGIKQLISLHTLELEDCLGFAEASEFPFGSFPSLVRLVMMYNQDLSDNKLSAILAALDASTAGDQLKILILIGNRLTRVPLRLLYFPNLIRVDITENTLEYLQVDSVRLNKTTFLNLIRNNLTHIEPGAFFGDYSRTTIYLDGNRLTHFYEYVYKPLLQSMYDAGPGVRFFSRGNPWICDCSIAWLIVHNRHLLDIMDPSTRCYPGGQTFGVLDPNDYAVCPT